MNLSTNVKRLRENKDLTQAELAKYVEVTPTMVNCIESGVKVPSLAVAVKMAEVLNCSLDDLVGRTSR